MGTRLIKIEMFIINFDGNEDSDKEEWEELIRERLNTISRTNDVFISEFQKKEIEWDDDIDINHNWATKEHYDRYFE
jgi:ribosomal protein S10